MTDQCPVCGKFAKFVICPEADLGFGLYCKHCNITGRARVKKRDEESEKEEDSIDDYEDF